MPPPHNAKPAESVWARPDEARPDEARPDEGQRPDDGSPAAVSGRSAGRTLVGGMSSGGTSTGGMSSGGTSTGGMSSGGMSRDAAPAGGESVGGASVGGWPSRFLAVLRETGNVSAAARQAGTSRSVCYRHRLRHAGFAAAWEDPLEEASDRLEMEAFRRAVDGVGEERFFGGRVIGEVTRYSDSLLMFLLRARRPAIYGPRPETDAVKSGAGRTGADETENDEQFLARLRRRMAALAEDGGPGGGGSAGQPLGHADRPPRRRGGGAAS